MVSDRALALTAPRSRAVVAFVAVAALVWWRGSTGTAAAFPPPTDVWLPALAAGLVVALVLSLVDGVTSALAGVVAAAMVMALPGFLPMHLAGPGPAVLLLATILMLVTMVHAPRWSLAYGAVAAASAVFLDPAALGLPIAAIAWAAMPHPANGRGRRSRVVFAVLPLMVAVGLGRVVGDAWPADGGVGWHGGLDSGLRAAGTIFGDHLAPGITHPAIRFFAVADLSLVLIAVVVMAWWRVARPRSPHAPLRRWYGATATLGGGIALGLAARRLFVLGAPEPDLVAVFPLVVLGTLASVTSVAALWPRWPRWGKALAVVVILGWLQAAVRG